MPNRSSDGSRAPATSGRAKRPGDWRGSIVSLRSMPASAEASRTDRPPRVDSAGRPKAANPPALPDGPRTGEEFTWNAARPRASRLPLLPSAAPDHAAQGRNVSRSALNREATPPAFPGSGAEAAEGLREYP